MELFDGIAKFDALPAHESSTRLGSYMNENTHNSRVFFDFLNLNIFEYEPECFLLFQNIILWKRRQELL